MIITQLIIKKCLTSLPPFFGKQISDTAASENLVLASEIRPVTSQWVSEPQSLSRALPTCTLLKATMEANGVTPRLLYLTIGMSNIIINTFMYKVQK